MINATEQSEPIITPVEELNMLFTKKIDKGIFINAASNTIFAWTFIFSITFRVDEKISPCILIIIVMTEMIARP